jgi:Fe-S oxidoreductase
MTLANQEFYEVYAYACNKCKSCTQSAAPELLPICPSFDLKGFLNYCGGGKAHMTQAILDGKVENPAELAEYFFACTMCMACKEMCPISLDHFYLIWDVRRYLFKNQAGIHPRQIEVLESVSTNNNPWSQPADDRGEWLFETGVKDLRKEKAEYLYFVGCASAYENIAGSTAAAAIKILQAAKVDFGIMGSDEICCGSHAAEFGDYKLFKKLARANLQQFKELGVKKVIVSDPHCYSCFTCNYPDTVGDAPVVHLFDFIETLLDQGRLSPSKNISKTATYHDPCRLSRHTDVLGAPRKLLSAILEQPLIEMQRSGKSTYCCGNGSGIGEIYPDLMEHAGKTRMADFKKSEAELLITACPYCMESFKKATGDEAKTSLESMDLIRLFADSLHD